MSSLNRRTESILTRRVGRVKLGRTAQMAAAACRLRDEDLARSRLEVRQSHDLEAGEDPVDLPVGVDVTGKGDVVGGLDDETSFLEDPVPSR